MFMLLSVISVCVTIIMAIKLYQKCPFTIVVHHKLENIAPPAEELTEEEKKALEEQAQVVTGMNEVIQYAQSFVGGDTDNATTE